MIVSADRFRLGGSCAIGAQGGPPVARIWPRKGVGWAPGARFAVLGAAGRVLAACAEIILGPLFAQSVSAGGQVARQRGIPLIAYSTDASVAAPGVHLLSFLPETEVDRVIGYAIQQGKKSFAALIPDNAYGTV